MNYNIIPFYSIDQFIMLTRKQRPELARMAYQGSFKCSYSREIQQHFRFIN